MKKTNIVALLLVCVLISVSAGCRPASEEVPKPTLTMQPPPVQSAVTTLTAAPDLCEDTLKVEQVEQIGRLMRHFDDVSILAQSTPKEQLAAVILEMQHIQHQVEDQEIPACLENLKINQQNYTRAVIATMTSFLQGASNEQISAQLNASRQLRQAYEIEKAAQLGIPYFTPTPPPTATVTPITPTATLGPFTATTNQDFYILQGPDINQPAIGAFLVGDTVNVIGRLASSDWLMIETQSAPGKPGWVPAQLVTLNVDLYNLPVVEAPLVE